VVDGHQFGVELVVHFGAVFALVHVERDAVQTVEPYGRVVEVVVFAALQHLVFIFNLLHLAFLDLVVFLFGPEDLFRVFGFTRHVHDALVGQIELQSGQHFQLDADFVVDLGLDLQIHQVEDV